MRLSLNALIDAVMAALALPNSDAGLAGINSPMPESDMKATVTLPSSLNSGVRNIYAGHRSHSSHSSHSSHASHYSGSGGSSPSGTSSDTTSTPSTTPVSPLASPAQQSKPTADQLRYMIMRVQAGLFSRNYDPGAIDGQLSDKTKAAIRKYQTDKHLSVTGTMTTE